jgi:hypothetical protein
MALMDNVSRPLIALLVATLALFALWFVALKPGSSSSGARSPGPAALQSDVAAAHRAVGVANHAAAAQGGDVARPSSAPAGTPAARSAAANASATAAVTAEPRATVVHSVAGPRHRLDVVARALKADKVVVLLFYNRAATDDRAVEQELAGVPTRRNGVFKLAVPLAEVARYHLVTTQVPVNQSPTLVIIDRARQASTIVGFADRFEIAHRVADAAGAR